MSEWDPSLLLTYAAQIDSTGYSSGTFGTLAPLTDPDVSAGFFINESHDTAEPAHVTMPGVHRIASLLKRWLLGTHQGGVSGRHLDYYLDEFTFRFNRRTSRARGLLFHRLMEQAATTGPTRYRDLVGGNHNG